MSRVDLRDPSSYPTRRVEAWKYSDLRRHLRETPAASPATTVAPGGPFTALGGDEVAVVNGRTPAPITVAGDGGVLRLRFVSTEAGAGHQGTIEIALADGATLTLLESHEGEAEGYVSNIALKISVGPDARLTRVVLADDEGAAIALSRADVTLSPGAILDQTTVVSGARLQRLETHVAHPGEGAEVRMDGLYLLDGARHADLTTVVRHQGRDGQTSQLTKGVVRETSRGVFQGKIVVERGADGTDARMGHHALILGERAEVDAKPELEIYADDVQCAHGNTVGNLDEAALFYIQSRGVPADEARALLTHAFLGEVVDRIAHEGAREVVREWLERRL